MVGRGPRRAALGEHAVDVIAITEIGRDAPGRGVRLANVTLLFEPGEHVPQRRRGDANPAPGEPERRHRLALIDVGRHHGLEDSPISFR